jgi:hypothetical protein
MHARQLILTRRSRLAPNQWNSTPRRSLDSRPGSFETGGLIIVVACAVAEHRWVRHHQHRRRPGEGGDGGVAHGRSLASAPSAQPEWACVLISYFRISLSGRRHSMRATDDLFQRFRDIHHGVHGPDEPWRSEIWKRFAALTAVSRAGEPATIAHQLRALAADLRYHGTWFDALSSPVRYLIASLALEMNLSAGVVAGEISRGREQLAHHGLCGAGDYVALAVVLHRLMSNRPLDALDAIRIAEIHKQMRGSHRWHTGPEDLPACVLLASQSGAAESMAASAEDLYQRLRQSSFPSSEALGDATKILQLTGLDAESAVARLTALHQAIVDRGVSPVREDCPALAMLCLIDHHPILVSERIEHFQEQLLTLRPSVAGPVGFALAADLAFLDLVRWRGLDHASWHRRSESEAMPPTDLLRLLRTYLAVSAVVALSAAHAAARGDVGSYLHHASHSH